MTSLRRYEVELTNGAGYGYARGTVRVFAENDHQAEERALAKMRADTTRRGSWTVCSIVTEPEARGR